MTTTPLEGKSIMVVEDEYLLADDLSMTLAEAGAAVCGPFPRIDAAAEALDREHIDCALLDVNLDGEAVFPLADALAARGIPFAFATGYDRAALPERFAAVPRIEKPMRAGAVVELLQPLIRQPR